VRIQAAHVRAIEDHARSGYPNEVCGVLVGRRESEVTVEGVIPVENRERELPRVRYQIAPEDLLRIQRESRASQRDVVGFYHSHPDHPARPSETDRRIAAEGLSDGVVHMVFSVDGSGRTVPSAWVFRDAGQAFEEEPLAVLDSGR
jgi:proteasome lid subunit RPN8/RPN11